MLSESRNQNSILNLFNQLPSNFLAIFRDYWPWHLAAITLTYLLVVTGFDWVYFSTLRPTSLYQFSFSAAIIGGLAPILVPLGTYLVGLVRKNAQTVNMGLALVQAAFLGSVISSTYKAFTGREHPDMIIGNLTDISRIFNFGFMRGGIFWGWPSSHTTIAFAMSVTLLILFPKNKVIKYCAIIYALYIGLNVGISIHWFSDFVAGAIIGTVIGLVVGKSFYKRGESIKNN